MVRAALCDGDRESREQVRALLDKYRPSLEVTTYEAPETLFWDMETDGVRFDLYLLPSDGRENAGRLWAIDREAPLIFLSGKGADGTAEPDGRVLGCLEKPVSGKALRTLLEKAEKWLRRTKRRVLVINQRSRTHVLRFEDIEYISSANHILRFYLRNGEECTCYGRLDQTVSRLDPELFVRCHQSHVVNLSWVTAHTPKAFQMSGGAVVPVSRSYALSARRALEGYLFHISALPGEGG